MLASRSRFTSQGPYLLDEDKLYLLRGTSEFGSSEKMDIIELATGFYAHSMNPFPETPPNEKNETLEGIYKCGNKLLLTFASSSLLSFYDLEKYSTINSKISRIKNQKFQCICSSRARDSLFFSVYQNSNSLHAYYVSSTSVTVAPPIRLDLLDRNKESITGITCHPAKPFIFIFFARGSIQVWNYSNLKKSLILKSGDDAGGGGDQSLEEEEDRQDDPDGGEEGVPSTKSSSHLTLTPIGVLLPPPEKEKSNIAGQVSVDPSGRLMAVVWSSSATDNYDCVGVYDIRYLSNTDPKQSPLGTFFLSPELGKYLGSICFHPAEPLLFASCLKEKFTSLTPASSQNSSTLLALSLLEPGMRVLVTQTLEYTPTAVNFPLGCNSLFLSSFLSRSSSQLILIRSYSLSTELTKLSGWMVPVVSKLTVPPEAYLEGDAVMYVKPSPGSSGGGWPLVLMVHNELDVFTSGTRSGEVRYLRPVNNFYNLYRLKLNMSSQEKNGVVYICNIPSVARNPTAEAPSWITIPEDNALASAGLFCPQQIKCNDFLTGGVAENGEWIALLSGTSLYAEKLATGKPSNLSSAPVVCFIKHSPAAGNAPANTFLAFGQFRDAIFYFPAEASVSTLITSAAPAVGLPATAATPQKAIEILTLSEDGMTLKFLTPVGASSSTFIGPTHLPVSISKLWSSGPNGANVLLYATEPASPTDIQLLYLTSPGMLNFDLNSSTKFALLSQERLLEVSWQPKSSPLLGPQARHLFWNESDQMIGILTTHRVLLLSSELAVLNAYHFSSIGSPNTPLSYPDRALSITWVGRSLIYSLESGGVDYLVPTAHLNSRFPLFIQGIAEAMGENPSLRVSSGRLCSLPNRQSLSGNLRLIGCLPDRLLYATTTEITGQSFMSVMARPCLPVEPLILGILQPQIPKQLSRTELASSDPFSSARLATKATPPEVLESYKRSLIESLLSTYVPAKPVAGANSSGGALPMTQSTRKLCLALCEAGYTQLVLIAAGICVNPLEGAGADFPRNRWITPGMKFHLALRAGKFAEGCNDLIASRPDLQELFIYPESYGGGTLPHRDSAHSKQFSAAACLLAFIGQFEMARKLADLAGDEILLAHLLRTCQQPNQLMKADLVALQGALKGRSLAYDKIFQVFTQDGDFNASSSPSVYAIPVSGVGGADRRTTMLQLSAPLRDAAFSSKDEIDLKGTDKMQRQHVLSRGGGLGPPTKLGVLAMDSMEDWCGRARPEVIAADRAHFSAGLGGGGGAGGGAANAQMEDDSYLPSGLDKPDTWVDEIGTGKEWDKVVGYWRFSDLIRLGEDDFYCSGVPLTRLNILDLSKFTTPLEVFADRDDRIQLQMTTSAVDPGEDHAKVKGLNDVVMSCDPYAAPAAANGALPPLAGLRVPVGRGGPLDLGLFHQDPNRCHFTMEMSIFRCESAVNLPAPPHGHCLAKRCCGLGSLNEQHFSQPVWTWSVDATGALCFSFGTDSKNELKTPPNEVNMGPTGDIAVSVWTHVAVVVDTSQAIGGSVATVSLFVNGNRSAKGTLHYPSVSEDALAVTTLYFGANLSGWRFTEIRVWADSRPVIDIDGQRDNYLPLASKRKRMQFRIKGSKKLFGPPPSSLDIGPLPPAAALPVFNIHSKKSVAAGEEEEKEKEAPPQRSAGGGGLGLGPPGGGKAGGLAPPGGGLAAPKSALSPPNSLAPPGKSALPAPAAKGLTAPPAKGSLASPPSGGLAPPAASRGGLAAPPARNSRRASLAGVPDTTRTAEASPLSQPPTPASPPKPQPEPETQSSPSPVAPAPVPSSSLMQPPGPSKALKSRRSSVGSFDVAAVSRNLTIARKESAEMAPQQGQGLSIASAGATLSDAIRCIRRRPLSGGLPLIITHTAQAIDDQDKILVIDMPPSPSDSSEEPPLLRHTSHLLSADSAILSPTSPSVSPSVASTDRRIAFYKNKKLSLVSCSPTDPSANSILGEMPMTFPLIFWAFDGCDRILLMTSSSLFSWDIRPSVIKASRPQKMIDRIDIPDPKRYSPAPPPLPLSLPHLSPSSAPPAAVGRWAERKVLKLNVSSATGWIVVVTCNRVNSENQPVSYAEALSSALVSVFHPTSHRSEQYRGIAACLLNDGVSPDPSLVIYEATPTGRGDRVHCIDLSALSPRSPGDSNPPGMALSELFYPSDPTQSSTPPPPWIRWSTLLQMTQVHLGVVPATAAPGALVLSWNPQEEDAPMLGVLSPLGELHHLSSRSGEVAKTAVVSEEFIFSSGFQSLADAPTSSPVVHLLTGNQGRLLTVSL